MSRGLLLAILIMGIPAAVRAETVVYTDQAAFLAATSPGYYLETFNSIGAPVTALPNSLAFQGSGFSYTASATNGLYTAGNSPSDVWLSTNTSTDPIVFNFTAGSPHAVGGFFFVTNINGNSVSSTPTGISVALNDGTTASIANPTSPTGFLGFVSSDAITSLQVSVTNNAGNPYFWTTVNDFIVGQAAAPAVVPEPSSLTLVGLAGIFGTATYLRRRRQAATR